MRGLVIAGLLATLAHPALASGWTDAEWQAFTDACVAAIVDPAIQDYRQRALAAGNDPDGLPRALLDDSIRPMCACIGNRVSEHWDLPTFQRDPVGLAQPLIDEALRGGRCRPHGAFGDFLVERMRPRGD